MKAKKNKKDPLRPKEDVRIEDKSKGFLNTLEKVVKNNKHPKILFDFNEFGVIRKEEVKSLPKEVQKHYIEIFSYLSKVLSPNQEVKVNYPKSKEVFIDEFVNIEDAQLKIIREQIYDYVIYDKPLP
ncbi:hypothetical protein [Flagellimonas lutaonensis]|uniref:Uncharacterized protein n=1 Tax=Flagellimonas lutaonensis TaxID=516051 RepID=A0A0D5YTI9_9FLAO|nr:hypothetical protein [Allomuricauda lutaonensis]AKA35637.1 hypothetical protein VC82_2036 [Allomuricauda lutaonensis]